MLKNAKTLHHHHNQQTPAPFTFPIPLAEFIRALLLLSSSKQMNTILAIQS